MKPKLETMGAAIRRLNPQLFEGGAGATWAEPGYEAKPRRRGPAPLSDEAELHDEIINYCQRRGWLYFHGSMAARTHRTEGEPDFVILGDGVRFFLVECKSGTGKLSPAQVALHAHAAKLGHRVGLVRSMAEFLLLVEPKENHEGPDVGNR